MKKKFQFVSYGLLDTEGLQTFFRGVKETWGRFGLEPFEGGMRLVYKWRWRLGPFEVRRWVLPEEQEEAERLVKAARAAMKRGR